MRIAKWGNSLAVRLPRALVDDMKLVEGDEISLTPGDGKVLHLNVERRRDEALQQLADLRWQFPPGYKFDRDEANSREP